MTGESAADRCFPCGCRWRYPKAGEDSINYSARRRLRVRLRGAAATPMNPALRTRLDALRDRFEELTGLLSEPDAARDPTRYRGLAKEHAELRPLVDHYRRYRHALARIEEAREMLGEDEEELRALARQELVEAEAERDGVEQALRRLLIPPDPADTRNIYLEIRAGTGGNEAALFAGDLLRMYSRYAERRGWTMEPVSASAGEQGGYKEIVARVVGRDAYARFKFEPGAHRVQRVPATESQGRIHTSACTVAVLPEAEGPGEVAIGAKDLRVDTFRASGAGGQHVNKTDSAVRITHLPSGLVVECQDERSQHKNRARAMALLEARLLAREQERRSAERAQSRRLQVGSGDRSERIRTYNFPQGRVTDHRINLTLYKLPEVMDGGLDEILDQLRTMHQAEQLATLEVEGG